jgi:hypothetical protein
MTYPGFWTTSLKTLTASSLDMFSKLMSFTCSIISPGSMRPSRATAPLQSKKIFYQVEVQRNKSEEGIKIYNEKTVQSHHLTM